MKLKWVILPLVLCLIIFSEFSYLKKKSYEYNIDSRIDKTGLYHNIAWGKSKDEVRKIFKNDIKINPREERKDELTIRGRYFDSMKDVNVVVSAFFRDGEKLDTIGVYIFANEDTGYDTITLRDKYKKKLDEVYGSPNAEYNDHIYEWSTINGAVTLKVWDDEEKDKQIGIFYTKEYVHNTKGEAKGYFDSIAWGTSVDEYAQKIEDRYGIEAYVDKNPVEIEINDYKNLKGINARIQGNFSDDALSNVVCQYTIKDGAYYSLEELKTLYKTKFDSLFSKPESEDDIGYIWKTPEGEISLVYDDKATAEDVAMVIMYTKK